MVRLELVNGRFKKISSEDKDGLEGPFSMEEIKNFVWGCSNDMALGPCGFTFKF